MERKEAIKNRIKELMEQKGMTYNTLAEKSGIPLRRVYRLATGMTYNPGVFTMIEICDALGVSLDEFFDTEELQKLRDSRA